MRISIVSFTKQGAVLARKIRQALACEAVAVYARPQDTVEGEIPQSESIRDWAGQRFADSDALVFVGALGIAVRAVALYLAGKDRDPAVVVLDEKGAFVIPVLSGHLGGANALARHFAAALGAQAVLTTATDVEGVFAVDDWAREQGYLVENVPLIKAVSGALLAGKSVCIAADAPLLCTTQGLVSAAKGELGVYVSPRIAQPFTQTLFVRPRVLTLGLGCRRGTSAQAIAAEVDAFLSETGYSPLSLRAVATIDLKADEAGLLRYCEEKKIPLQIHSAEELSAVAGEYSKSDFVRAVTGVDCVCERAAALHGRLVVRKRSGNGVALALSEAEWEARL